MKYYYKIIILILFTPLITFASNRGDYTKNKVIKKEFTVSKMATLNVSNKYGNVDIITSNTNIISITVTITTSGNDKDKVEKKLEQIDVIFSSSSNFVSAKTKIEKKSTSWSWFGNNNNVNMEINYTISMPVSNNLEVSNNYGSVNLDKIEGSTKFNVDYGKLSIGELLNSTNKINIDYTNNSHIDYMKNGDVNADYSTLHIERSERTVLNANYSHISFNTVSNLNFNCDYGSLKINVAGNTIGNTDYLSVKIHKLNGSGEFTADYGGLSIGNLGPDFKSLKVNAEYAGVKIGNSNKTPFNLTASTSYGGFNYGDGFTFHKKIKKSSSKYYEGYFKTQNSGNRIELKTSYGSISLKN